MDANLRSRLRGVEQKFKLHIYKIFTRVILSAISKLLKHWIDCNSEGGKKEEKKNLMRSQSGFVYTSYAAATTDMGMHVSRYVASC